jgi:hypothetical protein
MKAAPIGSVALLVAALAGAGAEPAKRSIPSANETATPDTLQAEIDGLKAARVAWREIAWKDCLLDGLKEARTKNKPALLWVFIDRPFDDARC